MCRPGDLVARLGGDEFVILISDRRPGCDSAQDIAERVLAVLADRSRSSATPSRWRSASASPSPVRTWTTRAACSPRRTSPCTRRNERQGPPRAARRPRRSPPNSARPTCLAAARKRATMAHQTSSMPNGRGAAAGDAHAWSGSFAFLPVSLALSLLVSGPAPVDTRSADVQRVGVIRNFGPDLQQAADGQCRQPEGLTVDPSGKPLRGVELRHRDHRRPCLCLEPPRTIDRRHRHPGGSGARHRTTR